MWVCDKCRKSKDQSDLFGRCDKCKANGWVRKEAK